MHIARSAWVPFATALLLGAPALGLPTPRAQGDDPAPSPPAPGMDGSPEEPEAPAADLDAQIKTAIEKGVAFLKSKQDPKTGSWGEIHATVPTYANKGT